MGDTIRTNTGLAGGYPGPTKPWGVVKDSDILEKIKRGEAVEDYEELEGKIEIRPPFTSHDLRANDVLFQVAATGGGGYGDPVKRHPSLVLKDVKEGYVSIEAAKVDYGVLIDPERLEVDLEATKKLRQEIVEERLRIGKR